MPKKRHNYKTARRQTKSSSVRRKYLRKSHQSKLRDLSINTTEERRMVQISRQSDSTWLLSRVDHFLEPGDTYPGTHSSPKIANMFKLGTNTMYWTDITQLPAGDPSDVDDGAMDIGLYEIKTLQSRLRFFVNGMVPVHIRVQLLRINNSGRYTAAGATNVDITPTSKMMPDTSLRYAGIHKIEGKHTTAPGSRGSQIIASKYFKLTPRDNSYVWNSTANTYQSRQVFAEKQVFLTKRYKRYLKLYQVRQQTTADAELDADENKAKFIGDRVFLCIFASSQQGFNADTMSTTATSSNVYFYGTSGCEYTYNKKPMQVSVTQPNPINNITQLP